MLASHVAMCAELRCQCAAKSLRLSEPSCYGFRLISSSALHIPPVECLAATPVQVCNRILAFCLEHFAAKLFVFAAALISVFLPRIEAQGPIHPLKANLPAKDEIWYGAVLQDSNGPIKKLQGDAYVETSEMKISADEIDFNSDTDWAYAHGHVHMDHFMTGDKINADHAEYNIQTEEGKFYRVDGTSPAKIMTSPGVLSTTNPFYFQAQWVERIKDRYILHHGFLTDCKIPKPWWMFQAPVFDIIPGDRAIAKRSIFRLRHVPVFYLPYYYRPLGRNPRESGFLTPNVGHSTLYGYIYGAGYYWAINRSYDMTGVVQYFTERGPAFTYNFRGVPRRDTDFNFQLYGVDDRGVTSGSGVQKQGGLEFQLTGRTQIAGFTGRVDLNYLSSLLFREAFSFSFATAIYNEVNSVGFLQRRFKDDAYTLSLVAQRNQIYEAVTFPPQRPNEVIIEKLPSVEFNSRDQQVAQGPIPVWWSFSSSAALLDRQEPTGNEAVNPPPQVFHTGPYSRFDLEPHVNTAFSFKGFTLEPGLTLGGTQYGSSLSANSTFYTSQTSCGGYPACPPTPTVTEAVSSSNLFRKDADFTLDFRPPSIERIYTPPTWLHLGAKLKHVVEGEAKYEYVTGINQFQRIIHFDETDILSNTNQLTVYLTNRLYRKDKNGNVSEIVTWRLGQAHYFNPTFGGAVAGAPAGALVAGERNVVLAAEELTPYPFLDGPRSISPVNSWLALNPYPFLSLEWRADYDPLRHKMIDQSYGVTVRYSKYFAGMSQTAISTNPLLVPQANQISIGGGYGSNNRKGWNVAANMVRDTLLGRNLFEFVQSSYNTDCCGFSVQYRRINFGIRNENQYLFSFSVANIGTFGSLQKQQRLF